MTMITQKDSRLAIPLEFICPISKGIMRNPMMSKTGYNFERDAIIDWVNDHGMCPVTKAPLKKVELVTNHSLKTSIKFWCDNNGVHHDGIDEDEHVYHSLSSATVAFADMKRARAMQSKKLTSSPMTIEKVASLLVSEKQRKSTPLFQNGLKRRAKLSEELNSVLLQL
jgi:hypothetical protein